MVNHKPADSRSPNTSQPIPTTLYRTTLGTTGLANVAGGPWWASTWPDRLGRLGIPIDHILVNEDLVPVHLDVVGGFGSDHRAVIATLNLQDGHSAKGD